MADDEDYLSYERGFWMHVNIDTVCSLEQQYRP